MKSRSCKICKKKYPPLFDSTAVKQLVCSCKCCAIYYDEKIKPKTRKRARDCAAMVGRRSMAEVKFDAANIEGKRKVKAAYEVDTFEYLVSETRKYTPDWTIITESGHKIYIEFKGVLDRATRKKMKLVKQQHPDLDIRIIFEKPGNKIMKSSKTTYGMWAEQWGFPWADNTLPREWLKE
jgi:hypothetical protein